MDYKLLSKLLNIKEEELEIICDTVEIISLLDIVRNGYCETVLGKFELQDNKLVLVEQSDYVSKIIGGSITGDDLVRRLIYMNSK